MRRKGSAVERVFESYAALGADEQQLFRGMVKGFERANSPAPKPERKPKKALEAASA